MKSPLLAVTLILAAGVASAQGVGQMQSGAASPPSLVPASQKPTASPMQLGAVPDTPAPSVEGVELTEGLTDANPAAFARRLGALLGAEIRLPLRKRATTLALKPGERPAVVLLDEVAQQLKGRWRLEFRFRSLLGSGTAAREASARTSKLPSAGKVPVLIQQRSFARAARALADAVDCRVALPDSLPAGRFNLSYREPVPVEKALADLGAQVGWTVSPVVVFEIPPPAATGEEAIPDDDMARRNLEQTTGKSELATWLEGAYGMPPDDEVFPWENIDLAQIAPTIQYQLDLSREDVNELFNLLRLDAQTRAALR